MATPAKIIASSKDAIIAKVKEVISKYDTKLTLRQIYYRIVAAGMLPNTITSYKKLGTILVEARKNGTIPYSAMEDRSRGYHNGDRAYESPAEHFESAYNYMRRNYLAYNLPKWWHQPNKVVVFVEKDALSGVFKSVTDEMGVDLVVCKGYSSLTQLHDTAQRLAQDDETKHITLLYFGDFDASGVDIERYARETLGVEFGIEFDFERIAITEDQIDEMGLVPAPGKVSDSRHDAFVAETGKDWQVELDAVEPDKLVEMIREAVAPKFDDEIANDRDDEQERRREMVKTWTTGILGPMPDVSEGNISEED
jgi:hypothetical protein